MLLQSILFDHCFYELSYMLVADCNEQEANSIEGSVEIQEASDLCVHACYQSR
jgi:hypothetical protein